MNVPMFGMNEAANTRNAHSSGNGTLRTHRRIADRIAANTPSCARTSRYFRRSAPNCSIPDRSLPSAPNVASARARSELPPASA